MTEGEKARLVAWSHELRAVHERLRSALRISRENLRDGGRSGPLPRDLLLLCHGFCTALNAHHEGEDRTLFPALEAAYPELGGTLRKLEQDHSMIGYLVAGLQEAMERSASAEELSGHLDGIGAIMESHFRYEERQLLAVLETIELDADRDDALGPL